MGKGSTTETIQNSLTVFGKERTVTIVSNLVMSRQQRHMGPSCFDKVKFGAMIGFTVGVSIGAIFGGYTGIRYGLRGRELVNQLGKTILQSGATFGAFMSVGSAIRC